jgi:hypothetical protein
VKRFRFPIEIQSSAETTDRSVDSLALGGEDTMKNSAIPFPHMKWMDGIAQRAISQFLQTGCNLAPHYRFCAGISMAPHVFPML